MMDGRSLRCGVFAALLCLAPMAGSTALADDKSTLPESVQREAEEAQRKIEEALARLLAGLKLMLETIPQYEAPELLENGDIIIRRVRPDSESGEGTEI